MKITVFGATGALGNECVKQCLDAQHEITVLARTPEKLAPELRERVRVIGGDGLDPGAVNRALEGGAEAALFAIGIDRNSPENLCTDVTRNILAAMPRQGVRRLVWCGGGSTPVAEDQTTLGSRFVEFFGTTFMGLRHRDKEQQLKLLARNTRLDWLGVRPLQMRKGPKREQYRLGFHPYSGFSNITFPDCAHAMLGMLDDDTWLHKAPILQY
jgi:putative NADH-flavin reductase